MHYSEYPGDEQKQKHLLCMIVRSSHGSFLRSVDWVHHRREMLGGDVLPPQLTKYEYGKKDRPNFLYHTVQRK